MTESHGIPTIRARIPAPPPPESALERLLATDGCLEPPRFVSDAIFVARGSDPFRRVAAEVPESLDDALRWFARADVRLVQAEAARAIEVSGTKAFSAYAYGYTVFWDQVGKSIPSWSSWERQLESDLGIPAGSCRIKLSLSPPGSGFPAHFDRYDTFQLQLLGTKVWHIAENDHVSFPLHGHLLGEAEHPDLMRYHAAAMPVRIATRPVELAPGDALYLPRGCWHRTCAGEPSLSVAIRVAAPAWLRFLPEELAREVAIDVDWRRPAYGTAGTPRQREACRDELRDLLSRTPETASLGALETDRIVRGRTVGSPECELAER